MGETNIACDASRVVHHFQEQYLHVPPSLECRPFVHLFASEDDVAWNSNHYSLWRLGDGSSSSADASMVINSHSTSAGYLQHCSQLALQPRQKPKPV